MASTPTTRNRFNQQGTGDNTGTWGTVLNAQALALVDDALDGLTSVAVTGNITLSSTNYATDQARKRVLKLTGTPGATFIVTIPSVEKWYLVHNATNAPQTVKAAGIGVTIPVSTLAPVYCDGTDCFTPSQTVAAAIGTVCDFAGSAAPSGWLLCYGQAVSRATYAALFGVIGATYGAGDGSTTFNVPDLRGRVIAGSDNIGGSAAGRLSGYVTSAVGGAQTYTLSQSELPATTLVPSGSVLVSYPAHTYFQPTSAISSNGGGTNFAYSTSSFATPASTTPPAAQTFTLNMGSVSFGSGAAHSIVQPTMAMNKIIYAGV